MAGLKSNSGGRHCNATAVDVERSRVTLDTVVTKQDGSQVVTGDALVMVEAPEA